MKDPVFEPLEIPPGRRSLGEHVFENLRKAILRGDIAPGQRLVESRIAETLGISRTPVREAIHKLEREGIIRRRPQGGLLVVGLTREEIEETFGIRSVLESYAARLAAVTHREEELVPLEEKIDEFQRCLDAGDLESLAGINTAFHDLLYALSRSPKLIKMINDLRDHIYRFRRVILKKNDMAKVSNDDHREMLRAIRERDAEWVEKIVREHVLRGYKVVLEDLGSMTGEL